MLRFYVNLGHLYPIDLALKCWGNLVDFNKSSNVATIPSVLPPSHNVDTTQNMANDWILEMAIDLTENNGA